MAYFRRIGVIKQLKSGFSADGGALNGIVKTESYAGFLKVEVSLINFAPLTDGRYVFGITDGKLCLTFDSTYFEKETPFDLANGFAFVVCFCNNSVAPVACAVCGNKTVAVNSLVAEIERLEKVQTKIEDVAKKSVSAHIYDDEAIADGNYYELETDKSREFVRQDQTEEEGQPSREDEAHFEPLTGAKSPKDKKSLVAEAEEILKNYPKLVEIERVMEHSKWVKIPFGKNAHYAFGVLYYGGNAKFLCYGVPSTNSLEPPLSLKGRSQYLPVGAGGYWIMYQEV